MDWVILRAHTHQDRQQHVSWISNLHHPKNKPKAWDMKYHWMKEKIL